MPSLSLDNYVLRIVQLRDAGRLNLSFDKSLLLVTHQHGCKRATELDAVCRCEPAITELERDKVPLFVRNSAEQHELGWNLLHAHPPEGCPAYAPPQTTLNCKCWPNLQRADLCTQGHLTSCHVGKTCSEARCSHLSRCQETEAG